MEYFALNIVPQDCKVNLEHYWQCYDDENINKVSRGLLLFGFELFKGTYVYENIEELYVKLDKLYSDSNIHPQELSITNFALNHMSDAISICTCFENYFKYKLLKGGYIIHQIGKHKVYDDLCLTKPLKIIKIKNLNGNNKSTNNIFKMRNHTHSLSFILDADNEFNEIFKLPQQLIEYLKELNDYRNMLHFFSTITANYSLDRIAIIKQMDSILQTTLQTEMESGL
jgi:hypothetical protein